MTFRRHFRFIPLEGKQYLAFWKPYGVLSQFTPEDGQPHTLADFGFPKNVYPVGRLDLDSEGLLILTDDGRLNKSLLDPEHGHARTYMVQVENIPTEEALVKLRKGVLVQGRKTLPCQCKLLSKEPELPPRPVPIRFRKNVPEAWISLTLTEGKNRQVRRMTAAIGHPTLRLVRYAIGSLTVEELELQPGEWKPLGAEEVALLFEKTD